jgi:uncharacterized protein DUF6763
MGANTPAIHIGRWYLRWDRGEIFQVTGRDAGASIIHIRTFDGGRDEIPASQWDSLPLGLADPPEDWAGPLETVDQIDMECAQPPRD